MGSGGFVEPLPDSIGEKLRSVGVPDAAIPHIIFLAEIWRSERHGERRLRGSKAIQKIDELSAIADNLVSHIDDLPLGVDDAFHNAAVRIGAANILEELRPILRRLDEVLAVARRDIEPDPKGGRPSGTWERALVENVAMMIESYGGKVDRRQSGALFQAVAILLHSLDAEGEAPTSARLRELMRAVPSGKTQTR